MLFCVVWKWFLSDTLLLCCYTTSEISTLGLCPKIFKYSFVDSDVAQTFASMLEPRNGLTFVLATYLCSCISPFLWYLLNILGLMGSADLSVPGLLITVRNKMRKNLISIVESLGSELIESVSTSNLRITHEAFH